MFRLENQVYRSDALARLSWLEHAFGTRLISQPPAEAASLQQIHSNKVIEANRSGGLGQADALVSNTAGLTLVVRTADCVPLLMADMRNRAVAAVHAGWRGTVQGVVPATLRRMADLYGTRTEDVVVAIGPAIGVCCYEVGGEVAQQFSGLFPERTDLNGTTRIDLSEAAVRQLGQNGVAPTQVGQIDAIGLCTRCLGDRFHSFRRDGEAAGRMFSWIRIRG